LQAFAGLVILVDMPGADEHITIQLTSDEALVLFEWLHQFEVQGAFRRPDHHGEQVALWNLSAVLERTLVQTFHHEYIDLVREARSRLAGEEHST
jgi:hypothetical protein